VIIMKKLTESVSLVVFLSALTFLFAACPATAQDKTMTSFKVVHVIGMQSIQHNAKGKVTVGKDSMEFVNGPTKSDLAISGIEDVQTGEDSQRMIHGTLGTITMFGPYGSGRFLSLFRQKLDTLTIEYRDTNGGLHGAIFTMPHGQAAGLKTQLVAAGAKASPVPAADTTQANNGKESK
jgi:hypothetical protein